MPAFDVIVPSYNNKKELLACLEGFALQTFSDFKLYVCLDGSTDGSLEMMRELHFHYPFLVLEHPDKKNHGRNATRNLALPYLDSEYVLFFDSDIIPYPTLLEGHYTLLKRKRCISVGNVDYLNKRVDLWAAYISSRGYNKFLPFKKMPPEYMNMGNLVFPTHIFKEIGGMDANLAKYGGDDTELSIRLEKHAQIDVINNTEAKGYSILNKTLDQAFGQLEEFAAYNLKYIHRKHPGQGHIYWYDTMLGKGISGKVFHLVVKDWGARLIKPTLNYLPWKIRLFCIHYLAAYHLFKGFRKTE